MFVEPVAHVRVIAMIIAVVITINLVLLIVVAIVIAIHLTRQTLGFYRESATPGAVELSTLVDSVLKLYDNKFNAKNITIEREFADGGSLQGLAGELKQLIANLVSNAADAVGRDGKIKLKIQAVQSAEKPGIRFTIEDDGAGIDPQHLSRIYEPFFTTKKDVGTGLGLWVAKEIVSRHNGAIEATSPVDGSGRGTKFVIFLPSDAAIDSSGMSSSAS